MAIDWNAFTPGAAIAGGLLIGGAATMLVLFNGRVAGISSVLGNLLRPIQGDSAWRIAFLLGLLAAPLLVGLVAEVPQVQIDAGNGALVLAGLCVGIGTRYGAGCTSGHGVCGLARLSLRSLVATLSFMAAGFATVFVLRHVIGGI